MDSYLVAMAVFAGFYALMALGLNLVWGMTGMINLGLAGFYAVGAYTSALVTRRLGAPIPAGILLGVLVAAAAGAAMALVTARLRGDYLAIVTLGFSEVVRVVASNEIWLTNGTDGISGVPGPWRGAVSPAAFNRIYLLLVLAAVAAVLVLLERLRHAPYGRVLRAIRDDEQVAAVAGKPVLRFKVEAFAVSAGILGLAGALYGHYTSYVAPDSFVALLTIYVVLALTAGGTGNNWGAVMGAFLVVFFLESARFLTGGLPGLEPVQVAAVREMLIGVALLVVLRVRPAGLVPERIPRLSAPVAAATESVP